MGRSGYSDDFGDETPVQLYRQAVQRAIAGYRGQHLLCRLRDALDAMPVKRLIAGDIKNDSGEVCALGALDPTAPKYYEEEYDDIGHARDLAEHFKVAPALASEIVYMNDEFMEWRCRDETPEERWVRMRAWVDEQIKKPEAADAVDPVDDSHPSGLRA
jgi:hypothetical protein